MTHDREAKSETAKTARRRTISLQEAIEDARQKFLLDALARVLHRHARVRAVLLNSHTDLAGVRSELHGVGQQVPDDLLQARGVGGNRTQTWFSKVVDRNALRVSRRTNDVDGRSRDRTDVQRPDFE